MERMVYMRIKQSLGKKLIIILVASSLLLGIAISTFIFLSTKQDHLRFISEFTNDIVADLVKQLDADRMEPLVKTLKEGIDAKDGQEVIYQRIKEDPYYREVEALMVRMKETYGVEYLYLFITKGDTIYFLLDADISHLYPETVKERSKLNQIGDSYQFTELEYKYLQPSIENKSASKDIILGSDSLYGPVISAWAPLLDTRDKEVLLMAEADVDLLEVEKSLRKNITNTTLLIISLVLIFVVVLYFMTDRTIIQPIQHLSDKVERYASGGELDTLVNDIFTKDEIQHLSESFVKMACDINTYIENLAMVTKEREKVATELNVAKRIQESMLPSIFPPFPDRDDFDIYAIMDPAKEIGGDFYDFFLIRKNKVGFVMADVSGKGVPAALFMMISKATIKNFALTLSRIEDIMENANNRLNENNETFMFVTAFLGILDLEEEVLSFVNAGHNPPLIRRKNGAFEYLEMENNQVLAIMPDSPFKVEQVPFHKGDMIFTYTDGVTEAMNDKQEFYQEARLKEVLNQMDHVDSRDIRTIVTDVKEDITTFVNGAEQADDITILLFKYNGKED